MALPASTLVLVWFAEYLTKRLKAHGSLVGYLSGIKKLHSFMGYSTKGFRGFMLKLTLQGLRKLNPHIPRQAAPMTPRILELIHAHLDHNNELDVVFWCTCIIGFFLLFRKSNLLPNTRWGFNGKKQLKCTDLLYTGKHIIVGIRWAKNEQFSRELMTFPLPVIKGSPLCPLSAINNVFRVVNQVEKDAHLFSLNDGSSLTYPQFQMKLRLVLAAAGVPDPNSYGSHSLRRGGCSFSFMCGVPSEIIKLLGNWKSDCYLKYLHFPMEARSAASELMRIRLMHFKGGF